MSALTLLLVVFGVYRCARMLSQEEGPFALFHRMREAAGQRSWFGRGLHCVLCWSWWLAGMAAVGLALTGHAAWADLWYLWPGIAGLAAATYQVVR